MRVCLLLCAALAWPASSLAMVPVGTVAIYSDGPAEKLLAIEDGRMRWEDDRKRLSVRSTNPIVPRLEARTFLSGKGYRQRVVRGDPDTIRTLPQGEPVVFSLLRTRDAGDAQQRHWECVFLGTQQKEVVGTERRLERYQCERFTLHRKLHNRKFRERREFSYSPDLGLVVDMRRETRTKRSRRKLVRLYAPDEATYRRISRAVRKIRSGD